ncbi:MAG: excisionase family DNA-binding protein [Actinomycetia bacterium]|nr:excisionase family DNA-binding protein [Actinomycetes bacterium]
MDDTQPRRASERTEKTVLPPSDVSLIEEIEAFLASYETQASLIAPDGTRTDIPPQVYDVLKRVVFAMANGSAVTVAPVSLRLTTSQAAQILGVSRPTLVRLLEDGAVPYEQPRRHRILRLDDVLAFKRNQDVRRDALLAEMTRQSAADGLYDETAEMYADALDEARHAKDL